MVEGARPKIFLSHITEDARIANVLADVIKRVYAGGIECWFSSDQSPAGGLAPGDQWYQKLHEQLSGTSRVFAIVTPSSVSRPWIYWEAAIGSVTCPGHVVPLVFGLRLSSLQPPLNYFQAVDGLNKDDLRAALAKVAQDADLAPDEDHLDKICSKFVETAKEYVGPDADAGGTSSEERLAAMLLGPLQNIQRRLEPLEGILRRFDMIEDLALRPSLRRPPSRLSVSGVPLSVLEDLLLTRGDISPYVARLLDTGQIQPDQLVQALLITADLADVPRPVMEKVLSCVHAYIRRLETAETGESSRVDESKLSRES